MAHVLVRHKVADYTKWKVGYDGHAGVRKKVGLKEVHPMRNVQNPNEMIVMFEAADMKKAQEFAASDDLRDTMQKAGVVDRPDIYFLS